MKWLTVANRRYDDGCASRLPITGRDSERDKSPSSSISPFYEIERRAPSEFVTGLCDVRPAQSCTLGARERKWPGTGSSSHLAPASVRRTKQSVAQHGSAEELAPKKKSPFRDDTRQRDCLHRAGRRDPAGRGQARPDGKSGRGVHHLGRTGAQREERQQQRAVQSPRLLCCEEGREDGRPLETGEVTMVRR